MGKYIKVRPLDFVSQKHHPLFNTWKHIIRRCTNPHCKNYNIYGGRGIKVCDRWQGVGGFSRFCEDVGDKPSPQHTIDRYPNKDGNYEPGNWRWATIKEQANNTNSNLLVKFKGRTISFMDFCTEFGFPYNKTLYNMKRKKWEYVPHSKKIVQMDVNGNEINIWNSLTDASKHVGISICMISSCLKGNKKTTNKKMFTWKYGD